MMNFVKRLLRQHKCKRTGRGEKNRSTRRFYTHTCGTCGRCIPGCYGWKIWNQMTFNKDELGDKMNKEEFERTQPMPIVEELKKSKQKSIADGAPNFNFGDQGQVSVSTIQKLNSQIQILGSEHLSGIWMDLSTKDRDIMYWFFSYPVDFDLSIYDVNEVEVSMLFRDGHKVQKKYASRYNENSRMFSNSLKALYENCLHGVSDPTNAE